MCPHTALYLCPHTAVYAHATRYSVQGEPAATVSAYCSISVSSYCCICSCYKIYRAGRTGGDNLVEHLHAVPVRVIFCETKNFFAVFCQVYEPKKKLKIYISKINENETLKFSLFSVKSVCMYV